MPDPRLMELIKLASPGGVVPTLHLAVCVASAILVLGISALRRPSGLLLVSIVTTIVIYRRSMFGFLLTTGIVFLFMLVIDRVSKYRKHPSRFRWRWTCAAIVALAVTFLVGRTWQLNAEGVSFAGIRWVLFALDMWLVLRLITVLWEVGSGRVDLPSIFRYSIWIAIPFTLLGPLLRYSQFEQQLTSLGRPGQNQTIFSANLMRRCALGTLQVLIGIVLAGVQASIAGGSLSRFGKLLIGFSIAPWSFYLLWAGYYKLMECLALCWGITLPPSFNRPFGRRNLSEFWANWNMSATSVFRDYLFYNRWGLRKANLYLNTLIVFLMVGAWHGLNGYWILWGLMHGLGFCAYLWYKANRSRLALSRQNVFDSRFRFAAPIATYLYVCSCWFVPPTILKLMK